MSNHTSIFSSNHTRDNSQNSNYIVLMIRSTTNHTSCYILLYCSHPIETLIPSSNVFIPNSDSYQDSVITTINVFLPCGSLWNFVKVPFYCHFSVYFLIPGALILLPKMKQNQILVKYIITELVMVFIAYWNAMFS